jgi:predicted SprT family Zn-dependent metalloprotease
MEDYQTLESAFNLFNKKLFDNKLPTAIITLQRKQSCLGYYSPERFENKSNKKTTKDEIAMNPEHFVRKDKEILATLAHEMCHQWQHHFGIRKSRTVYHNREWADKMEEIGLIPSNTGEPGGKRTGQKMTHYIDPKGRFIEILKNDVKKIIWESKVDIKKKAPKTRVKFTCPSCDGKAYAKPEMSLICGECQEEMVIE